MKLNLNGESTIGAILLAIKTWWYGDHTRPGWWDYRGIIVVALIPLVGCMSVKRGDFEVTAQFTDVATKDFVYLRTVGGVTNEYFHVKGPSATSSESVHWVCNAAMSIAGGCLGAPAGPVGVVGGAAAGGGVSELFQKWIDKGRKLVGK